MKILPDLILFQIMIISVLFFTVACNDTPVAEDITATPDNNATSTPTAIATTKATVRSTSPIPTSPISTPTAVTVPPTPIPPTPTPLPLESYSLSEALLLPFVQNGQLLIYLGWTTDGSQILAQQVEEKTLQVLGLVVFSIAPDLAKSSTTPQMLSLDTAGLTYKAGDVQIQPIRLVESRDLLILQEQTGENLFSLTLTDFSGQNQVEFGETTNPKYAISPDGWIAYVDEQEIVILDPERPSETGNRLSLDAYEVDSASAYFSFSLAPQGTRLALHDEQGHFQIVEVNTGETIFVKPHRDAVVSSVWSPDGQQIAYQDGYWKTSLPGFVQVYLSIVNFDGSNNIHIEYFMDSSEEPISLGSPTWDSTGNLFTAIASPIKCRDSNGLCESTIILVDKNYLQPYELFRQYRIWGNVNLNQDNSRLMFKCFFLDSEQGGQCVTDILFR